MTKMTCPGQDLGQRKSELPNVETSLAFLGNGKVASGLAYGIQCCNRGLGEAIR